MQARTNMLKLNCSYGQIDETCYIYEESETTKNAFLIVMEVKIISDNRKVQELD